MFLIAGLDKDRVLELLAIPDFAYSPPKGGLIVRVFLIAGLDKDWVLGLQVVLILDLRKRLRVKIVRSFYCRLERFLY